ncbi:MAG: ribosome rescue protein RqcH [Candidatus Hodarchaeales archaeon]|jgi:predicted ribosome quality control (RQC) complex YloA/Tae2 family protein
MKKKNSMTSSDISLILQEFQDKVNNYSIDNIYELNDIYVFRLKGTTPDFPRMVSLVVEPGKRIHLTEYKRNFPQIPSDKVLTFRKFVKKARITKLHQHGSDRIVIIEVYHHENDRLFSVYCELFGKGNIILVEHLQTDDSPVKNRVLFALWYRVMRDRRLLPGKEFVFPPTRGKSFVDLTLEDLQTLDISLLDDQIVKVLVRNFGVSGDVVEEILALADIPKSQKAVELFPERAPILISAIEQFKEAIIKKPPQILFEENDDSGFAVLPYPFKSISGFRTQDFSSFNKACDQFFSPKELKSSSEAEKVQKIRLKQLNKTLAKQEAHLVTLIEDAEQKKLLGDCIFENAHLLDELFTTILSANKKGMTWDDIISRLENAKQKGIASARILEQLDYEHKSVKVILSEKKFVMDFTKTPYNIAKKYYDKAKKAERKIEPAKVAIADTKEKITESEKLKEEAQAITKAKAVKKRKKRWYETYHWTRTTNGILVIAGRDAKSNERLIRRRLEKEDIFFHADVQGAPYTLLKVNEIDLDIKNQEPTNLDFLEAAIIAAVYSKAWKAGLGSTDVYSVNSDQVSFSTPSGEFLPKGGVIIRGKRHYYKNIPLKFWIGVYFDEIYAYLFVSGNEDVIKTRTITYTNMSASSQSGEKKGETAKKIQRYFERTVQEEDLLKLKTLTLNDYVHFIP